MMSSDAGKVESTIHVDFNRPNHEKVFSALHTLSITIHGAEHPQEAVFGLRFKAVEQAFSKRLNLGSEPVSFWVAINTHLLPNGWNDIEVTLEADGRLVHSENIQLAVLNDGALAGPVRESLRRRGAPLVFDGLVDAECFDTAEEALLPWYDKPDAQSRVDAMLARNEISEESARELTFLLKNGYVQLNATVEPETIAAANAALDDAIAKKYENYEYGTSQRITHLHDHYDAIRALWKHPAVLTFLRLVFDVEPLPCQTLTYAFGSQQDLHQDTIHLTSFPSGYMCGVWIALEDIQPNSGELVVVPGSHRFERVYRKSVGCPPVKDDWSEFGSKVVAKWGQMHRESGLSLETYRPKAGSILVWLDSLLHGGSVRNDMSLTRRSVVSHYFASGSVAYYDSTGLPGWVHR